MGEEPILTAEPMLLGWPLRAAISDPAVHVQVLEGMPLILRSYPQITVADFWQLTVAEFIALLTPPETPAAVPARPQPVAPQESYAAVS